VRFSFSKYGDHSMRPLAALLAILAGSAIALAVGLIMTWIVILFLPADEARFAPEHAALVRAVDASHRSAPRDTANLDVTADDRADVRIAPRVALELRSVARTERGVRLELVVAARTDFLEGSRERLRHVSIVSTKGKADLPEVAGEDYEAGTFWDGKGGAVVPPGREPGWMVPLHLRNGWDIVLGRSQDELPALLERLGTIDFFMHDSEHSEACMRFEFDAAWTALRDGGVLAADDVNANAAFADFATAKRREPIAIGPKLALLVK